MRSEPGGWCDGTHRTSLTLPGALRATALSLAHRSACLATGLGVSPLRTRCAPCATPRQSVTTTYPPFILSAVTTTA